MGQHTTTTEGTPSIANARTAILDLALNAGNDARRHLGAMGRVCVGTPNDLQSMGWIR